MSENKTELENIDEIVITNTQQYKVIDNCHGGVGSIEKHPILTPKQVHGILSVCARIVILPHSSIGLHTHHQEELEAYYITKGAGYFLLNDKRIEVKEDNVCLMKIGDNHGMENPNDEPMELIAIGYPSSFQLNGMWEKLRS